MGFHTYESYCIIGGVSAWNPNDSTTYLIGLLNSAVGKTYGRLYVPRTGIIGNVVVWWNNGTQNASAEDTTITIRKNDTTDGSGSYVGSFANASAPQTFYGDLPVSAGDYVLLKVVCPAWATNPTSVNITWCAEVIC